MGTHTSLQSVIILEKGSGGVLGQGLEGSGIVEEEQRMESEYWENS